MKNKKIIIALSVIFAVIVIGLNVSAYAGDIWDKIANVAGNILGKELVSQIPVSDELFGAPTPSPAGTTQTTPRISQTTMSIDEATTTIGSLYNSSGQDRIITNVYWWLDTSLAGWGKDAYELYGLDISTSTDAYNTTSAMLATGLPFPTSTHPIWESTTTPSNVNDDYLGGGRLWPADTYLVWKLHATMTEATSTGIIGVEYRVR